jgi:hypothetical protein
MNCSSVDLKAYLFGEAAEGEKRAAAEHVRDCAGCSEELERLRLTHLAMMSLRDEEPPRRIAFVSDRVFEPRWWQRAWRSGPAMVFASAALIACAILAQAYVRPAAPSPAAVDTAALEQRVTSGVAARLNGAVTQAVAKAVADTEARQQQKTTELLSAAEKRFETERTADRAAFAANYDILEKQNARMYMASAGLDVTPEVKQ